MRNVMPSLLLVCAFVLSSLQSPQAYGAAPDTSILPADRKVDWTLAGIPGGIPDRTQIFKTIDAAKYANASADATREPSTYLNRCQRSLNDDWSMRGH